MSDGLPTYSGYVLTFAIGLLAKVSFDAYKERRERRRAIALVLADLLEIRVRFVAIETTILEVRKIVPISEPTQVQLRVIFQQVFPDSAHLSARYDQAVTNLASLDPLLGYQLRSRNLINGFLHQLAQLQQLEQHNPLLTATAINDLVSLTPGALKDATLLVAEKHGWTTLRKTRKALKLQNARPKELDFIFKNFQAMAGGTP